MSDNNNIHENVIKNFPWINEAFFKEILQNDLKICVTVTNYKLKPALKHGENYTSEMLRANVNYITASDDDDNKIQKEINFIIKTALRNQELKSQLDESKFFEKEIVIYRDIFPAIEKLLQTIGDNAKFSAK